MLKAIEANFFFLSKASFLERARAEDGAWINRNDSTSRANVADDLVDFGLASVDAVDHTRTALR